MSLSRFLVVAFCAFAGASAYAQLNVTDAWVRGTVPGQRATGAFMKLAPTSDGTLVAAGSSVAATVEIHEMKMEGGVMKMRAIDRLPLRKGRIVTFAPGGFHIMLMDLKAPINAGDAIPIALTVEDASGRRHRVDVVATARPLGATHGRH
ncbi:MAG TPA: copper chaperone PCu(A)C [Casimicrobiaceae bacterium]|nr:copper chaperone PCu(A)C [Casimicrobiaceae bacterium]